MPGISGVVWRILEGSWRGSGSVAHFATVLDTMPARQGSHASLATTGDGRRPLWGDAVVEKRPCGPVHRRKLWTSRDSSVVSGRLVAGLGNSPTGAEQFQEYNYNPSTTELFAVLKADSWEPIAWSRYERTAHMQLMGCIAFLSNLDGFEPSSNEDLRHQLRNLLLMMDPEQVQVQQVNSHQMAAEAVSPLEDRGATWNQAADTNAAQANRDRQDRSIFDQHRAAFLESESEVGLLRSLHLDIASKRQLLMKMHDEEEVEAEEDLVPQTRNWVQAEDWQDAILLGWQLLSLQGARRFPAPVVKTLLEVLMNERERSAVFLAWLEIAVTLDLLSFSRSIEISDHECTVWKPPAQVLPGRHGQLTDAARARFAKTFFKVLDLGFNCDVGFVSNLDLSVFRVQPPQSRMAIFVSSGRLQRIDAALLRFTATRPVRCCNDLCRPLSAPLPWSFWPDQTRPCAAALLSAMHRALQACPMFFLLLFFSDLKAAAATGVKASHGTKNEEVLNGTNLALAASQVN